MDKTIEEVQNISLEMFKEIVAIAKESDYEIQILTALPSTVPFPLAEKQLREAWKQLESSLSFVN